MSAFMGPELQVDEKLPSESLVPDPDTDPVLAFFVDLINRIGDFEVGVTLHTGGGVVSGMLVSARRYFELLTKTIRDSSDGSGDSRSQTVEALAEFFQPWVDSFREREEELKRNDADSDLPLHVHLRHAQVFAPGGPPLGATLWRGRLTEVSGWSLGNYGEIPPSDDLNKSE